MQTKLVAALAVILLSCNQGEKTESTPAAAEPASTTKEAMNMQGYTAGYSNAFEMGDQKNANAVMILYKDWDEGSPAAHKEIFADSVEFSLGDGTYMNGKKDSSIAAISASRNTFSMVKSTVHSIFPVRSLDKNENWVCVWAKEVHTFKATGKTDSVELQEAYRFDKDGKINWLLQYDRPAAAPAPQKK